MVSVTQIGLILSCADAEGWLEVDTNGVDGEIKR